MTDLQGHNDKITLGAHQVTQVPYAVELNQVQFSWPKAKQPILNIASFKVHPQQHLFIKGPSGSGKSTLLSLLTGINAPQTGSIQLLGTRLDALTPGQRDEFRADNIGYIFQQFNLLPYLSVVDNVCLACEFSRQRKQNVLSKGGQPKETIRAEAKRLLSALNLPEEVQDKKATHLSIGQQQRVAAARALIGSPALVIADEPTSALDHDNRAAFIKLLMQEVSRHQATLIFVSHDPSLEPLFEQSIDLAQLNHGGQL